MYEVLAGEWSDCVHLILPQEYRFLEYDGHLNEFTFLMFIAESA